MTADPSTPAAGRERLRELAYETAVDNHNFKQSKLNPPVDREERITFWGGHTHSDFEKCEHPDCVLVRSALPASVEGSSQPPEYGPMVTVPATPVWLADFCSAASFAAGIVESKHPAIAERLIAGVRAAIDSVVKHEPNAAASAEGREQALRIFTAGWNAAKRDSDALDDEDVADAPDVAYSDYIHSAHAAAPRVQPMVTHARAQLGVYRTYCGISLDQLEKGQLVSGMETSCAVCKQAWTATPALQEAGAAPASAEQKDETVKLQRIADELWNMRRLHPAIHTLQGELQDVLNARRASAPLVSPQGEE